VGGNLLKNLFGGNSSSSNPMQMPERNEEAVMSEGLQRLRLGQLAGYGCSVVDVVFLTANH
jgi:hypothetical protein